MALAQAGRGLGARCPRHDGAGAQRQALTAAVAGARRPWGGAGSRRDAAASRRRARALHPAGAAEGPHGHRGPAPASALALSMERFSAVEPAGPAAPARAAAAPRLRVAVDVDEVLGRFVHALNAYYAEAYGDVYTVSDYWVYEYAKVWGCTPERSHRVVHDFFASPQFLGGIPPIPGAAGALERLGRWCDLAVVTSRQHVIQDATLDWLDANYPGTFQEVYFGNHFALEGSSRSKSDICASIGAHVLVDDNVGYALDCAHNGVRVLLFDWEGGYPWSKLPKGSEHPNIQVVRNWREVEQALAAMAPAAAASAAPAGRVSSRL